MLQKDISVKRYFSNLKVDIATGIVVKQPNCYYSLSETLGNRKHREQVTFEHKKLKSGKKLYLRNEKPISKTSKFFQLFFLFWMMMDF